RRCGRTNPRGSSGACAGYSPSTRSCFGHGGRLSTGEDVNFMADFNELPAHVWPRHAQRQEDGEVTIAGVTSSEIAEEFGTPVMVFDEYDFRSRCRDMADAFGGADRVHYASKAFLSKRIARWVNEEGLALDVASLGELQIALAAEFPAERITVHGNNKSA